MRGRLRKGRPVSARAAFTLIEMLIVVGIAAVLAALAVPAVGSWTPQSLESAARVVAADLRLARSHAVRDNLEFSVRFDVAGNSYEIVHTGPGDRPLPRNPLAGPGDQDEGYVVELDDLAGSTNSNVRLAGAVLAESRDTVEGVAFTALGGTGPRRSEDTLIRLTSGTGAEMRLIELRVSWVTGQVWIEREVNMVQ